VNEAIVDFLRRPVAEVLGNSEDQSVIETKNTLSGWVVGMARDPGTRDFLVEKLHSGLEKAGARTWGDILDRVPEERISEMMVAAARTDTARDAAREGVRKMVRGLLEKPIGTPSRWLPDNGPQRIEEAVGDPVWEWLETQVPAVVAQIDVSKRVEEKVLHFPMPRLEEIVRKVTDRELVLIVRLGYLLGAIIGAMLVVIDRVMS
jgi:uncharacterized membrane protein YheB (UPF0754 family)